MKKNIHKQIFYRAILTSPIISLLAIMPVYILTNYQFESFINIWLKGTLGVLNCWLIQALIFYFFKKKGYPNWSIILTLIILMSASVLLTRNSAVFSESPITSIDSQFIKNILQFLINASINFIIYLLIDLIYSQKEKVQLLVENATLRYNNLENDYKLLKAQINPHFLFNALNISKSLIKSNPKNAEKYIILLSEFLRNSLNNQQKSISLKEELAHVQQYVDLQKVRFENAFEYSFKVDNNQLEKHLPLFTLTTLVENALKHNSFSEEEPLIISVQVVDGFLEIKNNMKPKKGVVSSHTGLSNLDQRSKMLSGSKIKIENDSQFFSVKIKLMEL